MVKNKRQKATTDSKDSSIALFNAEAFWSREKRTMAATLSNFFLPEKASEYIYLPQSLFD
ncbi:unnamed protein product [Dovyalis caffra]|uniref:Uncharacterized protein n=1 Tax=Dovyalis caffra TaxID=77055 RepID=A0AAV1QYS6_9ROSI|nr:unnamed protein product [Dovyalis caffra]